MGFVTEAVNVWFAKFCSPCFVFRHGGLSESPTNPTTSSVHARHSEYNDVPSSLGSDMSLLWSNQPPCVRNEIGSYYNSEFTSVYGHVPPCQHHYAAYHGIDEWKQRQQEAARTKQYQPLPRPCGSDTYGDRREDGIERHGGIEKSGSDEAGGARTDLTQSLRSLPSVVIRRVKGKPAVDGENASLHGEEAERPIVLYADAANDNGVSVGKADTYTFSQYSMLSRGYSTKYKTAFDSHVNTSLPPEVFDNHDLLSGMDDYGSPKSIMPRVMERKRGKSVEWNLTESICSTHYGRDGSQTTPASQTSMATKPVIKRSNLRRCTLATALKKEARRELERIAPARLPA